MVTTMYRIIDPKAGEKRADAFLIRAPGKGAPLRIKLRTRVIEISI
jgi:hypothetical protein